MCCRYQREQPFSVHFSHNYMKWNLEAFDNLIEADIKETI